MDSAFPSDTRAARRRASVSLLGVVCAAAVALFFAVSACSVSSSSCSQSASVGCVLGATGWACTGTAEPQDTSSDLNCSSDGSGNYCCSTNTCEPDTAVSCTPGATGFSCAIGAEPPDGANTALICSSPTTANNIDEYCCFSATPSASSTCKQDQSVAGCTENDAGAPSYGFSCTGTENPQTDFTGLTCSASGTPGMNAQGAPATLFCCIYN